MHDFAQQDVDCDQAVEIHFFGVLDVFCLSFGFFTTGVVTTIDE